MLHDFFSIVSYLFELITEKTCVKARLRVSKVLLSHSLVHKLIVRKFQFPHSPHFCTFQMAITSRDNKISSSHWSEELQIHPSLGCQNFSPRATALGQKFRLPREGRNCSSSLQGMRKSHISTLADHVDINGRVFVSIKAFRS